MIWFRSETVSCASGMLKSSLFPTAERATALVDFLATQLGADNQSVCV
jgi:hypothetical protein